MHRFPSSNRDRPSFRCALTAIGLSMLFAGLASAGGSCPADVTGDGEVDGADLSVVLGGWGQPGPSDISGDGNTDGTDLGLLLGSWGPCPEAPVEISVAAGAAAISFTEGGSVGLAYTIQVSGIGDAAVVLEVSQLSLPSGLSIVNDVPEGGFIALSDGVFVFNMLVSGATPGAFSLETSVQPSEGDPASVSLPVAVLPLACIPELSPLAVEPAAVNPETPTSVVFSVTLSGTSVPPAEFTLARTQPDGTPIAFPATLRDDGVAPDLSAGDGVYSGQVTVNADPAEDSRFYKAFESVPLAGGVLETPIYELNVTPYPVGPAASDPGSVVEGPGGAPVYSNEVIIFFAPGTSDARIAEIVDLFDGTIVGSVPATGAYQVSFPGDGTFAGVQAVIAQMKTVVDVDIVEPLFPITTTELVPNDPLWPTQIGVAAIRATEAWTVATGEVVIAIVDTGVDATHPDFQLASGGSKVIVLPGSDVLDGDDDPGDPDGHGTRMAGIAAAIGNNGIGIAGVAWRSPILAVRAFGEGSSDLTLAQGIVFAAVNGARVINVSGGLEAPTVVLKDAIEYARERGCLIVASAGNQIDGTNVTTYPCAFAGVLCVGAVDNAGAPLAGANVSLSIDLVAPGEAVPTTVAGGGYGTSSGTSPAAAMVAGSAAVVWSVDPTAAPSVIEERLVAGAAPLPPSVLDPADGRLDLFESTFDGSFELPTLALWSTEGTVSVLESLGRLIPTDRMRMAYVSTGPAGAGVAASLRKDFVVQPGVTMFAITFDYDFVTEEWPEYVGTEFNDSLRIVLVEPDGAEVLLAIETINDSVFFPIEGIDFPGGDDTVGHTGWKTVTAVVPITKGPGSYTVRIEDAGDDEYDSVALVDRIRLVGDPQALYCGAPEAGDCCEANPTPFCADGDCCNTVCLIDPTCCQTEWDQACALLATQVCAGCAPEVEICDNGIDDDGDGLVDCDDPDCAESPSCTKSGFCGDPQSNSCCIVHSNPYCDDAECCEAVCAADAFCCATEWDSICADAAAQLCGGLCGGGGGEEICDNGIDDDGDGLVDCDDPDCAGVPGCCPDGQVVCGDACVDLSSDPVNCGDCGVVCDDGDPCTVDTCVDGVCVHTPIVCDDGNPCTVDTCVDGVCVHTPIVCDDGDPCTVNECVDGECVHTPIDADGDGYAPIACGGGDCDDDDPNVNPGVMELCSDGIDNDCDGLVDCDDPDCAGAEGCDQPLDWATVLGWYPDPSVVTDADLRAAIVATGLPWRVQDNASGIEMLLVPPGTFMMGCVSLPPTFTCITDETPSHEVTISQPFYLGRYEVTQAQWTAVMGGNPSAFPGPQRPVERVSWNQVQAFESQTGLRLPTEAEWEYACRGGTDSRYSNGSNDPESVGAIAWFEGNSFGMSRLVGLKDANPLGLHDIHGNISEWCEDWNSNTYYESSPPVDPPGPETGTAKVFRGGHWESSALSLASWSRSANGPTIASDRVGFRVARTAMVGAP